MAAVVLFLNTFTNNDVTSFQIGGTYAKPVLMPPQVAIGAIGQIRVSLVYFRQVVLSIFMIHDVRHVYRHMDSSS